MGGVRGAGRPGPRWYIDGELVVMNQPTGRHQDACVELYVRIKPVLPAGVKVRLSWGWKPGADEFGPDLIVFDDNGKTFATPRSHTWWSRCSLRIPPPTRCARCRSTPPPDCPRYWIIDSEGPELFVFTLTRRAGTGLQEATPPTLWSIWISDRLRSRFG